MNKERVRVGGQGFWERFGEGKESRGIRREEGSRRKSVNRKRVGES